MPRKKPGAPGLYKAINAKQERIKAGSKERMSGAKDPDRPSASDFKAAAKTAKKPKPKKK
jgi:hypothetical protein